jgi:hypothetical protein
VTTARQMRPKAGLPPSMTGFGRCYSAFTASAQVASDSWHEIVVGSRTTSTPTASHPQSQIVGVGEPMSPFSDWRFRPWGEPKKAKSRPTSAAPLSPPPPLMTGPVI